MSTTPSRSRIGRTPRPKALAHLLPAYAGRAMQAELERAARRRCTRRSGRSRRSSAAPRFRPSSISSATCSAKVETLIIGGGMANTFLAAQGKPVGKSLCESDLIADRARHHGQGEIAGPRDRAAGRCRRGAEIRRARALARRRGRRGRRRRHDPRYRPAQHRAVDLGAGALKTLVWNGPFGAFEMRAVRQRHHRSRRSGGGTHGEPAGLSALPAAATPWRRSMSPA